MFDIMKLKILLLLNYISLSILWDLGLFQKKIPGRGRRQAIYFSMGGWCGKFLNYMGRWCGKFSNYFGGRVPWLYQYRPGGFMLFVVLCPGTPEGSTGSGCGFKGLRRRDNGLKSHPTDWEKPGIEPAGIEPATPGLQDIGLSLHHFLWPCSLAVPVLAGWVCAFCGSVSRNSRRLNRQWFWF